MRIALSYSHRLKRSSDDPQPESSGIVDHLATALKKLGHEVELIEASGSLARFIARLEAMPPALTIHLGDLSGDAGREDLFQAIFDELGLPYMSPSMKMVSPLIEALALGRGLDDAVRDLVRDACKKHNLFERPGAPVRSPKKALRVGLTFNMKREYTEQQAEFDAPTTIDAIAKAIEALGHTVVLLEADSDLPMSLAAASLDVVFNVAEGFRGRGREAQVPALCEMLGIPYTGSDPSTLSICLAKKSHQTDLESRGDRHA
ncbi:MAG: hypothetical protein IPK82_16920 [Polyangiaceae bacterium]|nr:hypothetical protein [Polyangiaceae bacterium]